MYHIIEHNQLSVRGQYDVIVVGGGVAGMAAALASARAGKRTLLMEKSYKLGGLATLGLINLFVPMCNGRGTGIIRGMCEEFLRIATRRGYDSLDPEWRDGDAHGATERRWVSWFSPNIFAMEMSAVLTDAGVDILYDTLAAKPVMNGNKCSGVIVETKAGRGAYAARVVIDVTGDADLLKRAGAPTVQGGNYFTYSGKAIDLEHCRRAIESGNIRDAFYPIAGGGADLYGANQPADEPLILGDDEAELSCYIIKNHRLLLQQLDPDERFERDVVQLPGMPQLRTTRRLSGDYTLHPTDAYKHFDDSIGAICDFDRRDYLYEVPLRCLARRDYPNLITAGRSASGAGYAWDILRVIPPAIITGEAAGYAAAQSLDESCAVADIDIKRLQSTLEAANVMIHFDDTLTPADHDDGALKKHHGVC